MRWWARLFARLAAWCESHRVIRQHTFDELDARVKKMENESALAAQVRALQSKLDNLELFVGMKRQKTPTAPGTPNIT